MRFSLSWYSLLGSLRNLPVLPMNWVVPCSRVFDRGSHSNLLPARSHQNNSPSLPAFHLTNGIFVWEWKGHVTLTAFH